MAVRFDASTDLLSSGGGLPAGNVWTATMWAYMSVDRAATSTMFSVEGASAGVYLYADASRVVRAVDWSTNFSSGHTMTVGAWSRIAIVVNGSSVSLYTGTASGALTSTSGTLAPPATNLVAYVSGPSPNFFNGRIAALKVWGSALSAAEVEAELGQYQPVLTTGLRRYHPFLVNELTDYSGNSNNWGAGSTSTATEDGPPLRWDGRSVTHRTVASPSASSLDLVSGNGLLSDLIGSKTVTLDLITESATVNNLGRAWDLDLITGASELPELNTQTYSITLPLITETGLIQQITFTTPPLRIPVDLPQAGMRFMAKRILTDEWIDWDLPVSDSELIYTLSGSGGITGKFTPEYRDLRDSKLEDDSCWIFAEQDGQIRNSGILQFDQISDETLTFTAEGFTDYLHGLYYTGAFSQQNIDPLDIVRHIWQHIQGSATEANIGVIVQSTTSPVRLGTEIITETTTDDAGNTVEVEKVKPYELQYYKKIDVGREIDQLAVEGRFEFAEHQAWNATKTDVIHTLKLGYPRLGRGRPDLRFVEDENLRVAIPLKRDKSWWKNAVFVEGAGEGSDMIVGYAGRRDGIHIRRDLLHTDKTISSTARANAVAADILNRRQTPSLTIGEISIHARHPHAPLGSFDVGDDISNVLYDVPWMSRLGSMSHRIINYSYYADTEVATLQLSPSSSFVYGAA